MFIKNCQTRMFVKCTTHVVYLVGDLNSLVHIYAQTYPHTRTHARMHTHTHTQARACAYTAQSQTRDMAIYQYGG